jgi:O-antigen ligase
MSSGYPAASSEDGRSATGTGRRRRSARALPVAQSIYDWCILILLGAAPLAGMWLFGGVRWWSVGPLMMGVFLAGVLFCVRPLLFGQAWHVRIPPGSALLLAFLVYVALLVPRAAVPYDAHLEVLKSVTLVVALWGWTGLAGNLGRWRWLLAGLLLAVTVMAWYAIVQEAHGTRAVLNLVRPRQYEMRASGAYFCPNHFANLLAVTVPMALALVVMPAAGWPLRLFAGYSALVCLPPIFWSQSRSGWLGLLAGVVVTVCVLGLRRGVRRFLLLVVVTPLLAAGAAVMAWALSPMVQARVADALQGNVRLALWRDTLSMVADQRWLGFGPAGFRWVYPHYRHHLTQYLDPQFAHNEYLQLVAECGVVGAVLLLGGLLWMVARLLLGAARAEPDRSACLIAGFAGSAAAAAVHAGFDYTFHLYGNVQVLGMLAGITLAVVFASGQFPSRVLEGARRWMALGPALLLLALLGMSARAVASYGYALRGDFRREVLDVEPAQAAYERARRIAPANWQAHLGLGHLMGIQSYWNRDPESRRQQAEAAMAAYQRVRELNPWDTESRFGMSRVYNTLGQPDQAVAELQALVEKVPNHRDFLVELGLQLRQMGRTREALQAFERARLVEGNEMIDLNIQMLQQRLAAEAAGK